MGVINGLGIASDNPAGVPLIGYDNQITAAMLAANTEEAGFPAINLANPATHLFWLAALDTGGVYFLTISNPSAAATNYIAIAGHNFGSGGIPFKLQGITAFSPRTLVNLIDSGSPGTYTVPDDSPIIMRFTPGGYVGFELTFYPTGSTLPRAAVIYNGVLTVLERGIKVDVTHVPITYGRRTRIVNGMSESGNFLGRIMLGESRESRAEFFAFTPTFYRSTIDPFLVAAQTDPFFWAWAPSDYPLETGFAWLTTDAQPEVSPDTQRIALTLDMAGIA